MEICGGYADYRHDEIGENGQIGTNVIFNLSANNLFDVEARRHSSLLKDFAPLAGRDIRLAAHRRFSLLPEVAPEFEELISFARYRA